MQRLGVRVNLVQQCQLVEGSLPAQLYHTQCRKFLDIVQKRGPEKKNLS